MGKKDGTNSNQVYQIQHLPLFLTNFRFIEKRGSYGEASRRG